MEIIKDQFFKFMEQNGPHILGSIILLIVGLLLVKLFLSAFKKILTRSRLDPICHNFILSFLKIALYIIILIVALSTLGIPMTSLVTILGAAGLAIGLAIQDSLSNLAGGFILLFTKPFKVGDFIEVDQITGTVKHINILQTKLHTIDNKAIFVPNGQVSSAKIINYSAEPTRRLDLEFSVSYHDDIIKVKRLLHEVVFQNELALKEPAPIIRMSNLTENGTKMTVKVWVLTEHYWDLNYDLLEDVKLCFDKNDITIPFKQVDVNFISKPAVIDQ